MPWSNQGGGGGGPWGGGGGGRNPWGQGPGGGQQPPNLEELLRKSQDRFRGMLPGGRWGPRGILIGVLVVLLLWGFTGVFRVQPDEIGIVTRFGEYVRDAQPGLSVRFPSPIEAHYTPKVTRENQVNIGFRTGSELGRGATALRDVAEESLMLTGDENIVDIDFAVVWRISDAADYLFNIQQPANTVKAVAESVMREVVGRSKIDDVLTEGRQQVEDTTREQMQATLDAYGAGIEVIRVKLQKADPPAAVIDSFRDVQRARADQERLRNEAQAYANDIIPRARGESEQIRLDAEGYKEQVVNDAEGEVSRFLAIYGEYQGSKEVVRERMYLETMESVLGGMNKIVIDSSGGGQDVVPYLPLPEVQRRAVQNQVTEGRTQ